MIAYIVEPAKRTTRAFRIDRDLTEAMVDAGLTPGHVDFGTIHRDQNGDGVAMVVYEFGMFDPPAQQHYFILDGRLVAGNAVLFAFNYTGATVNMTSHQLPRIRYINGEAEIEAAIQAGDVRRPSISINGQPFWHWPQKAPKDIQKAMDQQG